jgi:hypothetical protein
MNKKGGAVYAGIIIGIVVFLAGILFVEHISSDIDTARVGLDCSNAAGITDGNKFTCLIVDTTVPYFIVTLIAISLGFITKWLV